MGKRRCYYIYIYVSTLLYNSQQPYILMCYNVTYHGNIDSLWPLYNSLSNLTFLINLSHVRIKVNPLYFPIFPAQHGADKEILSAKSEMRSQSFINT